MKLGLHQSARMEQRLVQSPQMIQAMQILQLSSLDLEERIEQELMENPFLELSEPEANEESERGDDAAQANDEQRGLENMIDELERYERDFGDGPTRVRESGEEADKKLEAMQNTPVSHQSLADALLEQLVLLDLDDEQRALAEYLIYSLDHRGYLPEPLEELAAQLLIERGESPTERRPVEAEEAADSEAVASESATSEPAAASATASPAAVVPDPPAESEDESGEAPTLLQEVPSAALLQLTEQLERILILLRDLTHPALGASDLRECLLLQLESHHIEEPLVRTLILDHLEDITANRLPRIARATGHEMEDVKASIATIGSLDPYPGQEYGGEPATAIHPDVVVDELDGEFDVRLTRQPHRELSVSDAYRRLLREARALRDAQEDSAQAQAEGAPEGEDADDVQRWIKKRLESARWFIDAVRQRQSTMLRISQEIFRHQRDFLEKGAQALRPLRMQEVADEVGVHISTVSRAVSGKFAQTPRGIFPLKFFFTSGTAKSSGEAASQVSIKYKIRELVEGEDPRQPYSDDALGNLLFERHGIRIARRTVTKYRKALSIPSSSQRKAY